MIDRRHFRLVFAFYMSLLMSCIMSLVISLINVGFIANIGEIWLRAWFLAFWLAFPTTYFVAPVVHRLVDYTLKPEHSS